MLLIKESLPTKAWQHPKLLMIKRKKGINLNSEDTKAQSDGVSDRCDETPTIH